jgi:hypothetical protein
LLQKEIKSMCADSRKNGGLGQQQDGGNPSEPLPNGSLERLIPQALRDILPSQVAARTVDVYTRHSADCPKRAANWKRCGCPKWIYLFHPVIRDRRFSADTRSWERAEKIKDEIVDLLDPERNELRRLKQEQQAKRVTIKYAVERFLAEAKSRELAPDTQRILIGLFQRKLQNWTETTGLHFLDELNLDKLEEWRNSWKFAGITKQKSRSEFGRSFASVYGTAGCNKIQLLC